MEQKFVIKLIIGMVSLMRMDNGLVNVLKMGIWYVNSSGIELIVMEHMSTIINTVVGMIHQDSMSMLLVECKMLN